MRRLRLLPAIVAAALGLSACGPTFTSLPLPGSGVSGNTITVKADFADALNLAQGAAVSINGVVSGRVQSVSAANFTAHVTMLVQKDANLRADAHVRLRYTTPLGELYVEVTNPSTGSLMQNNGTLGLDQTETAPTVEDALASASLLINGGGLNQLQTIITEANKALGGHESNLRSLITQSSDSLAQIYAAGGDIDRTLHALNAVSQSLAARRQIIHSALNEVGPAAQALRANTSNLTALLSSLDRFAGTANAVVGANKTQLLNIVRQSQPVLQEMADVRGQLAPTLTAILSLAKSVQTAIPGDYLNLFVTLHLDSILTGSLPGGASSKTSKGGGLLGGLLGSKTGTTPKSGTSGGLSSIPIIGGLL